MRQKEPVSRLIPEIILKINYEFVDYVDATVVQL